MIDQVKALIAEFEDVEKRLADPEVVSDSKLLETLGRRHKELGNTLLVGRPLQSAYENLETAKELMEVTEGDERDQLQEEVTKLKNEIEKLEAELRVFLLPQDPNDGRTVIIEIRGAEGGEDQVLSGRGEVRQERHHQEEGRQGQEEEHRRRCGRRGRLQHGRGLARSGAHDTRRRRWRRRASGGRGPGWTGGADVANGH